MPASRIEKIKRSLELAFLLAFPGGEVEQHRIALSLGEGVFRDGRRAGDVPFDQGLFDRLPDGRVDQAHRSSTSRQ